MTARSIERLQSIGRERRLQLLVDAVTDYAIYILDTSGFVASWNIGAERIYGYTESEIVGRHVSHLFTPEDRDEGIPRAALDVARRVGRHQFEGWRLRKDGGRFWVHADIESIYDGGELIGFAKITRDISERKAAHEALLESERRFRLLVEGVTDYAIYMLDRNGIVTNWNSGAARIKGYTADEIVGHHFSRFYTHGDRTIGMPAKALATAVAEGRYESEGWRVRKDGSRFWASVVIDAIHSPEGELIGFAKITRDATERRMVEEALRESERHFRRLVEGVRDYAIYMLDPNGVVISWNSGARLIKGYEPDEIIGVHFSRFYTDLDRAAGLPARALHTAAETGKFEGEGWRVRKNGSLFWSNVVIDAIRDTDGALVGFAKITRDITERREHQQALQKAQEKMAYAQKMDAMGQLTGGIAHDFNNLLMIVSSAAHILAKYNTDPLALRAIEGIRNAAKRGSNLTRKLLAFSRRQPLNPIVVDLAERAESFRDTISASARGNIDVLMTLPPVLWRITVDLSEFELALINLSVNARDAMPKGGRLAVNGENTVLRKGEVPGEIEGEFVAISMADTGGGIPPDILPKVFDPFFTTKGPEHGTGLGLSQVHGFVHQSGSPYAAG